MVVRQNLARHYLKRAVSDPLRQMLGPNGKSPGAGDDADMALSGFDLGLGTGRFPELELTHLIPARKLNLEYLERLHEGMSYAGEILKAIYNPASAFPGQIKSGMLRMFLLRLFLFTTGKSQSERRIRVAIERGQARARRDLGRWQQINPTQGS